MPKPAHRVGHTTRFRVLPSGEGTREGDGDTHRRLDRTITVSTASSFSNAAALHGGCEELRGENPA